MKTYYMCKTCYNISKDEAIECHEEVMEAIGWYEEIEWAS